VAGDITESGSAGARPLRIRPHWWAVLAVALALLALVAAATANHPTSSGHRRSALSVRRHQAAPPPASPTTTSTTVPQTTTTTVTPSTSPVVPPSGAARGNDVGSRPSTASIPTTTTTTPLATAASTGLGAAPTQPAGPVATNTTKSGSLQQPDDAFASYVFTGVGSMTVSVTWTYATPLSLAVTCPGGSDTKGGPSTITVVIPNAGGDCGIMLKETLVQYDAVDYVLRIGPTNGG
jgi:hypothetical protein